MSTWGGDRARGLPRAEIKGGGTDTPQHSPPSLGGADPARLRRPQSFDDQLQLPELLGSPKGRVLSIIEDLWRGAPPPQAVPLSPNLGSWDNRCGRKGQECTKAPPSCPPSSPACRRPFSGPEADPAVSSPAFRRLPLIPANPEDQNAGEGGGEGVRRWKQPVQAPPDTLRNSSRQAGTQWSHLSP